MKLSVLVTRGNNDGSLVTDLGIDDFIVDAVSDPNGLDGTFDICASIVCKGNGTVGTDGLYQIFLDRATEGSWTAGTYTGSVRVKTGTVYSSNVSFGFEISSSQG